MTDYAELLEGGWARTQKQTELLEYFKLYPDASHADAAAALEMCRGSVGSVLRAMRKRRAAKDPSAHKDHAGEGYRIKRVTTETNGKGEVTRQWTQAAEDQGGAATLAAIRREVEAIDIPKLDPTPAPLVDADDLVSIYPMGDPHFGMRAWREEVGDDFDLEIAKRDLLAAHKYLVGMAPPSKRAVIANMGDFLHADNASARTPQSGNILDVDGRHIQVARVGFYAFRNCVQLALQKHLYVDVVICIGNHDPESALTMKIVIESMFENEPRVNVLVQPRKFDYIQHGECLFGFTHGDSVKQTALGEVMAFDEPSLWGLTKHRHWYTGHVHHQSVKELRGVTVETVNTLAGRDAWHHASGYRARRSAFVDTWHKTGGYVGRQHWTLT